MTIVIDTSLAGQGIVFEALLQISRCDPGLNTFNDSPSTLRIAYQQRQAGVTSSNRLLALVNSAQTVLIVAVDSLYSPPGAGGMPIMSFTGAATERATLTTPITVWLDVTEAAGLHYNVHSQSGRTIYSPLPVSLYHELAHAWHQILKDEASTAAGMEVQATTDENALRAQLSLPLRNPKDHVGGIGPPDTGGISFPYCQLKATSWGLGKICMVATAAAGSPYDPTVVELRRAREEYRALSAWTAFVADRVLAQYGRFSPDIVRAMEDDPALRHAVLVYVVEPVAHLLAIIEAQLGVSDADALASTDAILADYVVTAEAAGCAPAALKAAAVAAAAAGRWLGEGSDYPIGSVDRGTPEGLFDYLVAAIDASGRDTSGFAWGIAGLALFLRLASNRRADGAELGIEELGAIAGWLGELPVPAAVGLSLTDAPAELRILAQRLFTREETRKSFAQGLLERWPLDSAASLESVLCEEGYLPVANREEA